MLGKVLLPWLTLIAAATVVGASVPASHDEPPAYLDSWWQWPPEGLDSASEAAVAASAASPVDEGAWNNSMAVTAGASDLWGSKGERWDPSGPLMDFSFAGYKQGAVPIPSPPVTKSFRAFQRKGMSDTQALLAALDWAHKQPSNKWVVIGLPAGSITLDRQLHIRRPRLILRGEGSNRTRLHIKKPLSKTPGVPKPNAGYGYYNKEAFIMVTGQYLRAKKIATVTGRANRGGNKVTVDKPSSCKAGHTVALILSDKRGVLTKYLLNNRPLNPGTTTINRYMVVRFITRILAVKGKELTLERSLPFDVRPEFLPEILPHTGTVHDVGIEGLSLRFPYDKYKGHHYEDGYNCIQFWEVFNCWARDIRGHNIDNGVFVHKSSAVQINKLRLTQSKPRNPKSDKSYGDGHWGVHNGGTADLLVDGFEIEPFMLHAVGSDAFGMYAVFTNGKMRDGNLELHRALSHALFTDIDVGLGERALRSGGPQRSGPNTQAWTVFWNLRSRRPIAPPAANGVPPGKCEYGPDIVLAGLRLQTGKMCGYWIYQRGPATVANLYEAMLERRLGPEGTTRPLTRKAWIPRSRPRKAPAGDSAS